MPAPHASLEHWRPDQVAECTSVSMSTSTALWMFVSDDRPELTVKQIWRKLSQEQQEDVNQAMVALDEEWASA